VKLAQDTLATYEHALRELEFVQAAAKYDNRALIARSLVSWASAQNTRVKTRPDAGVPENQAAGRWAAGYAAALERRTPA